MSTPTPTRNIEDRLTAALHARADQVTHADLTTLLVPRAHRSRRPAVLAAGLAAVVAAAIVAVPLVGGDGGSEPQPAPAPDPTPSVEQGRDEVRVDLDGDGTKDRAWIGDGALHVDVSSGTGIDTPVTEGSYLLPPVTDAGTPRPVLVVLGPGRGTLATYDRDGVMVVTEAPESLVTGPGRTAWVDDIGALMVGDYDAEVPEDQRVLVSAMALRAARNGNLVEYGAGDLCWDRVTNAYPLPCEQLPAQKADPSLMFPTVETGSGIGEVSGTFDGQYERAELRRAKDGTVEAVLTWDGIEHHALVGEGDGWTLVDGTVAGGGGDMPALLVRWEGPENDSYLVVSWFDGKFQAIPTADDGGWLGTGFVDDQGQVYQRTWLAQSGVLWTAHRIDADKPDRYDLVRWSDRIGPTLEPVDQGEVCLDLDAGRKLDDATCGAS